MDSAAQKDLTVEDKLKDWQGLVPGCPDFVIQLKQCQIPCHKEVLRKASSYFDALFSSQMKETESNRVTLEDTEQEPFLLLCEFAYTGHLGITEGNMFQLAALSSMFQFNTPLMISQKFMVAKVASKTWLEILLFSDLHQLSDVFNVALRYVLWNFTEELKTNSDNYKHLPIGLVSKILGHSLLNCDMEFDVVHVLSSWMQSNVEYTEAEYTQLFKSVVYLDAMSVQQLNEALTYKALQKVENIKKILEEKMKSLEFSTGRCELILPHVQPSSNTTLVGRRRGPLLILCVGGDYIQEEADSPSRNVCQVDPVTAEVQDFQNLQKISSTFETKMGYRASTVGTDLYITGGEAIMGRNTFLMDVWRYSSFDDSWTTVTRLLQPRRHHGIAVLEGRIYLIGGLGRYRQVLTSVQSYNTATDEWRSACPLQAAEFWPAVAVCGGEIYCVKNSLQKYSPHTDQWTTLTLTLPFHLGFHSAVTIGKIIYLKGQYDGRLVRLDTSCPDYRAETVATFSSCPNGQLIALNGSIYCLGGEDCTRLQRYDVRSEEMTTVDQRNVPLTGFSLVLLPHFPFPL